MKIIHWLLIVLGISLAFIAFCCVYTVALLNAEVRASSRADGSELGHNGCDALGLFFL